MTRPSPFKGLASFDESDADARLFFGREREREIIVANLLASRLTVLYGDTGVGKSSVLRAGVARDLRALPEPLAVVVFDDWQDDPAGALESRVAEATGADSQGRLVDTLELGAGLVGGEVFVILDGLEEEFLYHGSDAGPGSFLAQFSEAATRPGLRASFLLAIREDALAKLDRFKSRVPNVFGNYLRLDHLDRDEAREAIRGPVDRYNESAVDGTVEIEAALVEAVLDQVAAGKVELGRSGRGSVEDNASSGGIEAPFLQLVMERLWEAEAAAGSNVLRLETLERLGGAEQIVRDHLDRALDALDPVQRDVAAAAFNHLVTPSGTKIAHDASDLAGYVGAAPSEVAPVLSALAAERILRPVPGVPGSDQPRYEIYHDILADAVLDWRRRHDSEREVADVRSAAAKRHRRLLLVAAGAVLLAGVMAGVTIFAFAQRSEADTQARSAKAQAFDGSALSELTSDSSLSLALAVKAAELEQTNRAQDVLRKAMIASRARSVFPTEGPAAAAHFSMDGSRVLVAGGRKASIYDRRHRLPVRTFDHGAPIVAADFIPNSKLIFTAGADGMVRLWSVTGGPPLRALRSGAPIRAVSVDRAGVNIAAVGGRVARVWHVRDGRLLFTRTFAWPVTRAALSSHGTLLAVIGNSPSVTVYRVEGGERLDGFGQEPIKGNLLKDVAFSPDDKLLAAGGRKGGVFVWELPTGKLLQTLPHKTQVLALAFSPDGKALATAGADGIGRIWNVSNGRLRVALFGHTHFVLAIAFSSDGEYVVTASSDRTARVWGVGGEFRALLAGHSDSVTEASFSPGQHRPLQVLTASDDGSARLWDPQTQPRLQTVTKEPGPLLQVVAVKKGLLLVAGPGSEARLLRAADGRLVRRYRVASKVVAVAASGNGRLVVVGAGRTATLFDRKTGRRLRLFRQPSSVEAVALSSAGDLLATGGSDGLGRVWALGSRRSPEVLRGHLARVTAVAFSPDGEHIATGSADATARIWDLRTRRSTSTLKRDQESNAITSVTFSPDREGKWLLTSSTGTDLVLWNAGDGTQRQVLRWHFGAVNDAVFSPDGRWIVSVGPITLQLWRPGDRDPLFRLGIHGPGGMTSATFDSSSRRLFAVAKDGQVLTYLCRLCGGLDDLLPLARAQLALTRGKLSSREQKTFGG